jgi:hypothetical protein
MNDEADLMARASSLRICTWTALSVLVVTAVVPVLFFQFPGPKFMPLPYESMWAITELFWKPLRILQVSLSFITSHDFRQHVNPYFVAPFVNVVVALVAVYGFLKLRNKWRKRPQVASVQTDPHSVVDHIDEIRKDYPAALHQLPHRLAHAEDALEDARMKLAGRPFFQQKLEQDSTEENEKHE